MHASCTTITGRSDSRCVACPAATNVVMTVTIETSSTGDRQTAQVGACSDALT
jgi:hypothetical protein